MPSDPGPFPATWSFLSFSFFISYQTKSTCSDTFCLPLVNIPTDLVHGFPSYLGRLVTKLTLINPIDSPLVSLAEENPTSRPSYYPPPVSRGILLWCQPLADVNAASIIQGDSCSGMYLLQVYPLLSYVWPYALCRETDRKTSETNEVHEKQVYSIPEGR